jgi:hypothetical protein
MLARRKEAMALQSGSSYTGMNRIKFTGLIDHLSAFIAHPGQRGVCATWKKAADRVDVRHRRGLAMAYP